MQNINNQVRDNFSSVRLWHLGVVVGVFALLLGGLMLFGFTDRQVYPQINKDISSTHLKWIFSYQNTSFLYKF